MKLLLTSNGVRNNSMKRALGDLLEKPISEASVVFIPTAAGGVSGDKTWLENDINDARNLGWKHFEIIELTQETEATLRAKLSKIDAIFVNGGNPFYLKRRMDKSGFTNVLPEILEKIVYVSSSAGGIVTSKYLSEKLSEAFEETKSEQELFSDDNGLGLVDFIIKPHLHSGQFSERTTAWAERAAEKIPHKIYFIDDQTALQIIDDEISVISEGEWKLFDSEK